VLFLDDHLEGFGLSAEDSAAVHAIMAISPDVNRERLEFLSQGPALAAFAIGDWRALPVRSGRLRLR
jgi:hypothetical protein